VSVAVAIARGAAAGRTPAEIARDLRVDRGLVDAVLDHASRVAAPPSGREARPGATCGPCAPVTPLACAGCPLR